IYFGRDTVCRRRSSQHIGDEAFIIPPYGMVGGPARRRAPVPVKHILPILTVPVPFNSFPEGIGACSQLLFIFITLLEVFPYANQRLRHKGGFYKVPTVVVLAKWLGPARGPIQPMRPCAM